MDLGGQTDSAGSGQGPVAGFCEHDNESSGSIKKAGYFFTSWETISFSNNILHHWANKYYAIILRFFSIIWRIQDVWSVVDLLCRNPHWWCPISSSTYGINFETRILATVLYVVGDSDIPVELLQSDVSSSPARPQSWGPPLVGCPRLLHSIDRYPACLGTVSSIRNLAARHVVVTGTHITWLYKSNVR
jgi:hypothetical protein